MAEPDNRARDTRSGASAGKSRVSLARALSKLGFASRSRSRELVLAGKVALNGRIVRDPDLRVDPARDRLAVEGQTVDPAARVYLVLNKPRGVLTTASDEKGRDTVYSLLPPELPWVGPVGRLDKASEGLLLLTNDSRWADRITSPASHLDKTYHVQIDRLPDEALLRAMASGVAAGDDVLSVKRASLLRAGSRNAWLEVVLDEGKNRQIRRIMQGLGTKVLRLVRVSIGPLELGGLARGESRRLTAAEKAAIDQAVHGTDNDALSRRARRR